MIRRSVMAIFTVLLVSARALAADGAEQSTGALLTGTVAAAAAAESPLGGDVDWSLPPIHIGATAARPAALPVLYGSLAALNVYDVYSTRRALAIGGREVNAQMTGVVSSPVIWGVKAATTALPILLAERMWRDNKIGAIAVMVTANGIMAAVAANNARALHQLR